MPYMLIWLLLAVHQMPNGRQTRRLTEDQIERLDKFRRAAHDSARGGYSFPQLKLAMSAPFGYKTLGKALKGLPVWDLHHSWIVSWIERYLGKPAQPAISGKDAAAGEREEESERDENPEATGTIRGSR